MAASFPDYGLRERSPAAAWTVGALARLVGAGLLALAAFLTAALLSFSPDDASLNAVGGDSVANWAGEAGAIAADLLLQLFGLAGWFLPLIALAWGGRLVAGRALPWFTLAAVALPLALLAATVFLASRPVPPAEDWPFLVGRGGILGDVQYAYLQPYLPPGVLFWGALALALAATVTALGVRWSEAIRAAAGAGRFTGKVGSATAKASSQSGRALSEGISEGMAGLERLRLRRASSRASRPAPAPGASKADRYEADPLQGAGLGAKLGRWLRGWVGGDEDAPGAGKVGAAAPAPAASNAPARGMRRPGPRRAVVAEEEAFADDAGPKERSADDPPIHLAPEPLYDENRKPFAARGKAPTLAERPGKAPALTVRPDPAADEPERDGREAPQAPRWTVTRAEDDTDRPWLDAGPDDEGEGEGDDFEPPARERPRAAPAREPKAYTEPEFEGEFELPDLDMLMPVPVRPDPEGGRALLDEIAAQLETVLDDFGVRGQIVDVKPGPVVTMFELEPAPGTRAQRVIGLADDIARSLCALSVRVATVPGRNVIGIELPNDTRETVLLRELFEDVAYHGTNARLPLAMGKNISGVPVVVDLARMPHLLIAGTTGSGKSVAINAMILSLLYRLTPDQCRMIMIDPKVVELSVYEDIPHLLAPVVTEPHKAVVALKWVVQQMDERYRLMYRLGVREIFAFNKRIKEAEARGEVLTRKVRTGFEPGTGAPIIEEQPIEMKPLPLIVVIVDEVADLMLTAGKEIEGAIMRLSQKARAAGIHLIVATQRPSVDVLTGVIKSNLPSRVSFRVSSKIDSRTILSEPGAEQLLGQGDMLYMMPGDRILRIHGPLVTDEEVERVVHHLKLQGEPDYVDSVTEEGGGEDDAGSGAVDPAAGGAADDLYTQAVRVVAQDGKASTSYLQRKLSIGYNSAAKLIERMETEGLITPADHVGRRRVLMGRGGVDGTDLTDGD